MADEFNNNETWSERLRRETMAPQPGLGELLNVIGNLIGSAQAPSGSPYGNEPLPAYVSPYVSPQAGMPGMLFSNPPDPTMPIDQGGAGANLGIQKLWTDFMGAGGQKAEFRNPDGTTTKLVKKEPPAPKQPGQPGKQPGAQGVPLQQQPWSGYAQPAPPVPSIAEEDARIVATQQAQMAQQELARRNVGNLPYSPVFRPGEGPISPAQEYQQRIGLAEKERAVRQQLIAEGTPTRGKLLAEQYANIAASTGKGMRIVMAVLKQNPFWTDEAAALGADHEQARQAIIMDRSLNAVEREYLIKKDAVDRLVTRQTTQRAEAKKNLQDRLALEPERAQDPRYLRDHLMADLNIAEKDVPQFLADHYDPITKTYNIVKSPYEEMVIMAKNNANALTELMPTLPPEMAIMAQKHPDIVLKYFSDKEAQYNYRAGIAKTPEERGRWEERRDFAAANKNRMAQDPKIWNLTNLIEVKKTMWNKMDAKAQDRWYNDFAAAHKFAYGPSLDRDPKKIYMDYYEQGERIKGHILDNEYKTGQITLQKEKGKQAANIVDDTIGTFPGHEMFRSKKANVDIMNDLYQFHQMATQLAVEGTIPTGDKPEEKKVRAYIEHLRGKVATQLPTDIKKDLGPLSDKEMVYLANNIYSAQTSSPPQIPNLYYMAELIRRERGGRKK